MNGLVSSTASAASTSILYCPLCQKPFVQEPSYKRHVSYCRKTQSRQRARMKACRACNSAKTKCTFEEICRRCRVTGLQCSYDQPRIRAEASREYQPVVAMDLSDNAFTASISRHQAQFREALLEDGQSHPADFETLTEAGSTWPLSINTFRRVEEFESTLEPQITIPIPPHRQRSLSLNFPHFQMQSTIVSDTVCQANGDQLAAPLGLLLENGIPMEIHERLGTLARLQPADPVAQHNMRLIIHALRAYPYMMLRRETFPPFIHPHWHSQSTPALPWPLANCMSIASLFVHRNSETTPFLWQTVKRECQRCLDEITVKMNNMSEECFLAAIQVQIMYLIMRLVDEETQPDPLNIQLLATFKVLCQHFKVRNGGDFFVCQSSVWESWIHTESRVRILIVFFLISRVISVFTGMNCPIVDRYRELPLCATKGPWEAKTRIAWAAELAACSHTKDAGLCTIGQMIDHAGTTGVRIQAQTLDSWNAAADNLGSLLHSVALGLAHTRNV